MQCPSRFLKQPSPKPVVPIKMAIIGPPKSGKTGCKFEYILIITCKVIDVCSLVYSLNFSSYSTPPKHEFHQDFLVVRFKQNRFLFPLYV